MSRMRSFLVIFLGLLVIVEGRSLLERDNKPETPKYDVKNSTRAFEIRQYANGDLCARTLCRENPRTGKCRNLHVHAAFVSALQHIVQLTDAFSDILLANTLHVLYSNMGRCVWQKPLVCRFGSPICWKGEFPTSCVNFDRLTSAISDNTPCVTYRPEYLSIQNTQVRLKRLMSCLSHPFA